MHKTQDLWFDLSPAKKTRANSKAHLMLYDLAGSVQTAIIIIFILFVFLLRPAYVSGRSMLPTLKDGDMLMVLSNFNSLERGDIVVIAPYGSSENTLVKRIIAVGGDTLKIDYSTGAVELNGEILYEPYIKELTHRSFDMPSELIVPEGFLFVMGDNRNDSLDSRHSDVGFVDERYVFGKAQFRLYPFGEFNIYENRESRVNNGQ
ncbi:MAG: signal peptidase I [Clostridiales bacterium]|nr:signal peptidase I [Clostridiales bacterium]